MSPEQARGKPADRRADIWAFGVVLYEMLTAKRLFDGPTVSDSLASVLKVDPDWSVIPTETPLPIRRLLGRCLDRDSRERLPHIGEARLEIRDSMIGPSAGRVDAAPRVEPRTRVRAAMFGVVVGALLVALVAGLMVWGTAGDELVALRPQRLSIDLPEGTVLPAGLGTNVAISPDGQSLAYVAPGAGGLLQLYLRPLDEFGATPIPGTEGAIEPFFSPDGEWIAFWSQVGNRLSRIPRSGGEPFLLCEQCSHGFWGDDDSILFARNGALWRMPGTGGTAELLVGPMPDRGVPALDRPVLLPGGQAVLFEIGLLGFGGIGVLSLDTGEYVQVSDNGANPLYSPTGHILFARGSTLFGVPFDAEELTVTGPVVPVVQGVRVENGGALQARVSPNGLLVYVPASEATGTRLVWVDRDGGVVDSVFDEPRVFNAPRQSPFHGELKDVRLSHLFVEFTRQAPRSVGHAEPQLQPCKLASLRHTRSFTVTLLSQRHQQS